MSTQAKADDGVNRLLDIVVEEVSLVDRAANKHRFLIVKRSEPMEENPADKAKTPDGEVEPTDAQTPPADPVPKTGEDDSEETDESPGGSMLEAAVEALERLTETVETLGALADGDARLKIGEIAGELRALADRLAETAGAEPAPPPEPESDLASVIESVRAVLQQVGALLDANKAAPAGARAKPRASSSEEKKRDPAAETETEPTAPDNLLRKDVSGLADSVRTLALSLKEQQQRLARLEKSFGLPNSAPSGERRRQTENEEDVSWPLDLNRGLDRENVDKAVSFHDV